MAIVYKDITEELPYTLSNPTATLTYSPNAEAFDVAIGGLPFMMLTSDATPYQRQTAQYRKNQVDQSAEPGEQSITGWWVRSQSSFHHGMGIVYYDPSAGEIVAHRFTDSKGVDIWTKGKVTLLNDVLQKTATTGDIASNGRPQQTMRSITYSGNNAILFRDNNILDKIATDGTVTHFKASTDGTIFAVVDDGATAYWVVNQASHISMIKKPLTGSTASTADETVMFSGGTGPLVTNCAMEWVKERIIACINNSIYEIAGSASALPTAVYTHPNTSYVYTSVTASGPAVYVAGYNGIQSTIQKFTLNTSGALPTLTSAITAAEMPPGEIIHKIYYYLGHLFIGTSKGVRAALVNDQDGSLQYGPLIVETSQPVYDFAARDHYIWATTGAGTDAGLIRFDIGGIIETLRFAYNNDIFASGVTGKKTTSVAFFGNTSQLAFATNAGFTYVENTASKVATGYITTGRIRYSTLENKVFKTIRPLMDDTYGGVTIESIDFSDARFTIANYDAGATLGDAGVTYPVGPAGFLSFKFTISRYPSDVTKGPVFSGYQLKALPAIKRQRLIQYPLSLLDEETDRYGVSVGYEGWAYDRQVNLEALEDLGDTIKVEDYRTGESYLGTIEEIRLTNNTPTDKTTSGYGGVLLVTMRKIS